jgi:hypothetical protein
MRSRDLFISREAVVTRYSGKRGSFKPNKMYSIDEYLLILQFVRIQPMSFIHSFVENVTSFARNRWQIKKEKEERDL